MSQELCGFFNKALTKESAVSTLSEEEKEYLTYYWEIYIQPVLERAYDVSATRVNRTRLIASWEILLQPNEKNVLSMLSVRFTNKLMQAFYRDLYFLLRGRPGESLLDYLGKAFKEFTGSEEQKKLIGQFFISKLEGEITELKSDGTNKEVDNRWNEKGL